jgi:hypothetical protein
VSDKLVAALRRIKKRMKPPIPPTPSWNDWMLAGKAIQDGYNFETFMNKWQRYALKTIMKNRTSIKRWHDTLTKAQRQRSFGTPLLIVRHWRASKR